MERFDSNEISMNAKVIRQKQVIDLVLLRMVDAARAAGERGEALPAYAGLTAESTETDIKEAALKAMMWSKAHTPGVDYTKINIDGALGLMFQIMAAEYVGGLQVFAKSQEGSRRKC